MRSLLGPIRLHTLARVGMAVVMTAGAAVLVSAFPPAAGAASSEHVVLKTGCSPFSPTLSTTVTLYGAPNGPVTAELQHGSNPADVRTTTQFSSPDPIPLGTLDFSVGRTVKVTWTDSEGTHSIGPILVTCQVNDPASAGFPQLSWTGMAVNEQPTSPGYFLLGTTGLVDTFGRGTAQGVQDVPLKAPVVGMASAHTTVDPPGLQAGYEWAVAADGGVFALNGLTPFYGSAGSLHLNSPIVGMAAMPTGRGYWLVGADGGVFAYGAAQFYGSMGGDPLNSPIVGIAATPDGLGYYLVAADGGIFAFGDARFKGSMGGQPLNKPIVGMALDPATGGYWLVASDGGVFSFGAPFDGSTGSIALNQPIVGMSADQTGSGYWMVAADGGMFTFGTAPFLGSAVPSTIRDEIVVSA